MNDRIKKPVFLRTVHAACVLIKEKWQWQKYFRLGQDKKIQSFEGIHQNERCFIIGNGPSLRTNDLEKLTHEYTFAANRIYEIFNETDWRPWSYLVIDSEFIKTERERVLSIECKHRFLSFVGYYRRQKDEETNWIYERPHQSIIDIVHPGRDVSAYMPDDISKGFSRGHTVTFTAIQLAVYMGFREIYLLGVDFNYSIIRDAAGNIHKQSGVADYFNGKTYGRTLMDYYPTLHAYKEARKYCDNHGIKIYNATRGGKLEVFERVDFDSLFPPEN